MVIYLSPPIVWSFLLQLALMRFARVAQTQQSAMLALMVICLHQTIVLSFLLQLALILYVWRVLIFLFVKHVVTLISLLMGLV